MQSKPLPAELSEMIYGFRKSRILFTAIELDIFSAVKAEGDSGAGFAAVAGRIQADGRASEMLLNSLVALGFLEKKAGFFRLNEISEDFLSEGSPLGRQGGDSAFCGALEKLDGSYKMCAPGR